MKTAIRTAAALSLFAAMAAQAADTSVCNFSHPAVARSASCSTTAGIDPNTFIVQPPASTRWLARADADVVTAPVMAAAKTVHANYAHPAVAVARMQATAGVDPNTFIVQPPATVSWTVIVPAPIYAGVPAATAR